MKFIEHHINVMMDIWGGVDAIRAPRHHRRSGRRRPLAERSEIDGDIGHASQDDIDALFE